MTRRAGAAVAAAAEGAARPGDDLPEVPARRSRRGATPAPRRWPRTCAASGGRADRRRGRSGAGAGGQVGAAHAVAAARGGGAAGDGAGRGRHRVEVPRRGTAEGHRRGQAEGREQQKGIADKQTEIARARNRRQRPKPPRQKGPRLSREHLRTRGSEQLAGHDDARQILDEAEKRIPQEFADQPELQEELLNEIGTVYDKMTWQLRWP